MASAAQKAAKRAQRQREEAAKKNGDPEQKHVDALTDHVHKLSAAIARANEKNNVASVAETDDVQDGFDLDDDDDQDSDEQAIAQEPAEVDVPQPGTMKAAHHHTRHMPKAEGDIHGARIIDRPLTTGADG